jgi:hypothetical protein
MSKSPEPTTAELIVLRTLLRETRQYVVDAGREKDSHELLAQIDRALSRGRGRSAPKCVPTAY